METEKQIVLLRSDGRVWRNVIWRLVTARAPERLVIAANLLAPIFGFDAANLAELRVENVLKLPLVENERVNRVSREQASRAQHPERKRV